MEGVFLLSFLPSSSLPSTPLSFHPLLSPSLSLPSSSLSLSSLNPFPFFPLISMAPSNQLRVWGAL